MLVFRAISNENIEIHDGSKSYGRLVASYLSFHTRDLASAEDALSNALVAALTTWPQDGVPKIRKPGC